MPKTTKQPIRPRGVVQVNESTGSPGTPSAISADAMGRGNAPIMIDKTHISQAGSWASGLSKTFDAWGRSIASRRQQSAAASKSGCSGDASAAPCSQEIRAAEVGLVRDTHETLDGIRSGEVSWDGLVEKLREFESLGAQFPDTLGPKFQGATDELFMQGVGELQRLEALQDAEETENFFNEDMNKLTSSAVDADPEAFQSALSTLRDATVERGWTPERFNQLALDNLMQQAGLQAGSESGDMLYDRINEAYSSKLLSPNTPEEDVRLRAFLTSGYEDIAERNIRQNEALARQKQLAEREASFQTSWDRFASAGSTEEKQALLDNLRKNGETAREFLGDDGYARLLSEFSGTIFRKLGQGGRHVVDSGKKVLDNLIRSHAAGEIGLTARDVLNDPDLEPVRAEALHYLQSAEGLRNQTLQPFINKAVQQFNRSLKQQGIRPDELDPAISSNSLVKIRETIAAGYSPVQAEDVTALDTRDLKLTELTEKAVDQALLDVQSVDSTNADDSDRALARKIVSVPPGVRTISGQPFVDIKTLRAVPADQRSGVHREIQRCCVEQFLDVLENEPDEVDAGPLELEEQTYYNQYMRGW